MKRLPASIAIGLWIVGSIWIVAIFGYVVDAPAELIWIILGFGVVAGFAEWLVHKRAGR
jgi:hypothetical protein